MRIQIHVNTENDAFQAAGPAIELARILRQLAAKVERAHLAGVPLVSGEKHRLMDANGNTCGRLEVTR